MTWLTMILASITSILHPQPMTGPQLSSDFSTTSRPASLPTSAVLPDSMPFAAPRPASVPLATKVTTSGGPVHQAPASASTDVTPVVSPAPPTPQPALVPAEWTTTLATHYPARPARCWDRTRSTPLPATNVYAAAHLPCGTQLVIRGPAGEAQIGVWDHGPNCACPERGLDLSPAAFSAVVGPLGIGVAAVQFRIAG